MNRIQRRWAGYICLALCLCCAGCATKKTEMTTRTAMDFMDTISSITLPAAQSDAADAAFAQCRTLDACMSARSPQSEIGQLNRSGGKAIPIRADTAAVLRAGQTYGTLSEGLLDITIAPASLLWDFTAEAPTVPDAKALADAATRVDYRKLVVTAQTASLPAGMGVDLGALAKGYAADQAAAKLRALGVKSAVVNLGGCVVAIGSRPDGAPWRVGIAQPFADRASQVGILQVRDCAVVTAGVYERSFERDGILYHHILNPRTGMPCDTDLSSATVIVPQAMDGDALSTLCILRGEKAALALLAAIPQAEGVLVRKDGTVVVTAGIGKSIPFEAGT